MEAVNGQRRFCVMMEHTTHTEEVTAIEIYSGQTCKQKPGSVMKTQLKATRDTQGSVKKMQIKTTRDTQGSVKKMQIKTTRDTQGSVMKTQLKATRLSTSHLSGWLFPKRQKTTLVRTWEN